MYIIIDLYAVSEADVYLTCKAAAQAELTKYIDITAPHPLHQPMSVLVTTQIHVPEITAQVRHGFIC